MTGRLTKAIVLLGYEYKKLCKERKEEKKKKKKESKRVDLYI
jgi:hypothetical protein